MIKKLHELHMKKQMEKLDIKVPTSWKDVTLTEYINMQNDLKNYTDIENQEEVYMNVILFHLTGLEPKYIKYIKVDDFNKIKIDLLNFISKTDFPLQTRITLNGKEYGIIPNLSNMTMGEYLDITSFDDLSIDKNWSKICSILYRPVSKTLTKNFYEIEPYTGDEDKTIFENLDMEFHFGIYGFFLRLSKDCVTTIQKYLIPSLVKSLKKNTTTQKNGEVIQHYIHSLMVTSQNLTKL